jgi:hypothetical protein
MAADASPFAALPEGISLRWAAQPPPPMFLLPIKDAAFGTTVRRITDPAQGENTRWIRHYYSKADPFNADEALAVLFGSNGSVLLYDTTDWRPVRTLQIRLSEPEVHWDPRHRNHLYYFDFLKGSEGPRGLYRYDVATDRSELVHSFDEYASVSAKLEGNPDRQGRFFAMVGRKGAQMEAFVYDLWNDRIGRRLPVTESDIADWISVSPSGKLVVMMGRQRSSVFDLQLNRLRDLPKGSFGHGDMCLRADGSEVLVYDGADHQLDNNRNINMADLATGAVSKLVRIGWGTTPHVSCRNLDLPGWALVSTQGPDGKYPNLDFQIFWVRLDGSGEVRRLAYHWSKRGEDGYFAEQHAVPSRNGSKVIFSSNWGGKSPIADYLVELPLQRIPGSVAAPEPGHRAAK